MTMTGTTRGWVPIAAALLLHAAQGCGGTVETAPIDGGGGGAPNLPSRSCAPGRVGADNACGLHADQDCCAASSIPGGTYNRLNDAKWPATVSPFRLDLFEVTVGRFRAFLDAYPASRPAPGDGAHPKIAGSGWQASWNDQLPSTRAELLTRVHCAPGDEMCHEEKSSWTDGVGANERLPMAVIDWHVAFAFCAWDGGRLPTDAEWNFAAVGGSEQRPYPWGTAPLDTSRAVYLDTPSGWRVPVGSVPAGVGRWGQLDLSGSRLEMVLDHVGTDIDKLVAPCDDCADLATDKLDTVDRDMSFNQGVLFPAATARTNLGHGLRFSAVGVRCARDP